MKIISSSSVPGPSGHIVIKDHVLRYTPGEKQCYVSSCCLCCYRRRKTISRWEDVVMTIEKRQRLYLSLYRYDDMQTIFASMQLSHIYNHIKIGGEPLDVPLPEDGVSNLFMSIPEDMWNDGETHTIMFNDEKQMREWLIAMKSEVEWELSANEYVTSSESLRSFPVNPAVSERVSEWLWRFHKSATV